VMVVTAVAVLAAAAPAMLLSLPHRLHSQWLLTN
jgi:hypothetical protein